MTEEIISKKDLWAEFDMVFNKKDKDDQYVHVIITFWQESIENISVFDSLQLAERYIDFLPEGFERDIGDHETYQEMEGTGYRHFVVQMNDTNEQQGATQ